MAEFPDIAPFVTTEQCSQCRTKPAVFLHHVLHKGQILRICTSCVLQLHQGSFCPICFRVYDDQFNLSNDHVKCTSCENVFHLSCIQPIPSFSITEQTTGASSSSSSTAPQFYYCVSCPYCVDPNKKIFEFSRDGLTNAVKIDTYSAQQLVAAAIISMHSMVKAAKIASVRAQIMCKEAAEAKKEAKDALKKLDDLAFKSNQQIMRDNGSENSPEEDEESGNDSSD